MEKHASRRLLDAAYEVIATRGAKGATVRAVEAAAGLPHGSVRHHFGSRPGLMGALVEDLVADDLSHLGEPVEAMLARLLGPGRTRTIARYELFLLAARDENLRQRIVHARDSLVAQVVGAGVPAETARALVAGLDGLVLDGILRGDRGIPAPALRAMLARLTQALGQRQ